MIRPAKETIAPGKYCIFETNIRKMRALAMSPTVRGTSRMWFCAEDGDARDCDAKRIKDMPATAGVMFTTSNTHDASILICFNSCGQRSAKSLIMLDINAKTQIEEGNLLVIHVCDMAIPLRRSTGRAFGSCGWLAKYRRKLGAGGGSGSDVLKSGR